MQKILELGISWASWIQKLSFGGQNHPWLGQIVLAKQRVEVIRFPMKYWLFYPGHENLQLHEKFPFGYNFTYEEEGMWRKYTNSNWLWCLNFFLSCALHVLLMKCFLQSACLSNGNITSCISVSGLGSFLVLIYWVPDPNPLQFTHKATTLPLPSISPPFIVSN